MRRGPSRIALAWDAPGEVNVTNDLAILGSGYGPPRCQCTARQSPCTACRAWAKAPHRQAGAATIVTVAALRRAPREEESVCPPA